MKKMHRRLSGRSHKKDRRDGKRPQTKRSAASGLQFCVKGANAVEPTENGWGKAWIEAIEGICHHMDCLQKGKVSTDRGLVRGVRIEGRNIAATVEGERGKEYESQITLKGYSKQEEKELKKLFAEHFALAAELGLNRLPLSLLGLLLKYSIPFFPRAPEDLQTRCNCRSGVRPCKHVIALCFCAAGMIDRDPSVLFSLRNMPAKRLYAAAGVTLPGISHKERTGSLFVPYKEANMPAGSRGGVRARAVRPEIDFLFPSPDAATFTVLFAGLQGALKESLMQTYVDVEKAIGALTPKKTALSLGDVDMFFIYQNYDARVFATPSRKILRELGGKAHQRPIPYLRSGKIVVQKKEGKKGVLLSVEKIFDVFLERLSGANPKPVTPSWSFLCICASIALGLAKSRSFVPEVTTLGSKGDFLVRYIPLVHDDTVRRAITQAKATMPPVFGIRPVGQRLLTNDGAAEVISRILTRIVNRFSRVKAHDRLHETFFRGRRYRAQTAEERLAAKEVINRLIPISMVESDVSSVIKLEPRSGNTFDLHLEVEDKTENAAPVPLSHIFAQNDEIFCQPAVKVRTNISRQVALAAEHLPQLRDILNSRGDQSAQVNADAMAEFLTRTAGILETLGMRIIVPKELKEFVTPQLSVQAQVKGKEGSARSSPSKGSSISRGR